MRSSPKCPSYALSGRRQLLARVQNDESTMRPGGGTLGHRLPLLPPACMAAAGSLITQACGLRTLPLNRCRAALSSCPTSSPWRRPHPSAPIASTARQGASTGKERPPPGKEAPAPQAAISTPRRRGASAAATVHALGMHGNSWPGAAILLLVREVRVGEGGVCVAGSVWERAVGRVELG